jgi:NADH:ubiquinone oxidoreductase subunit E
MSEDQVTSASPPATDVDLGLLDPVLKRFPRRREQLIPLLRAVQDVYGYIPELTVEVVATHLRVSRTKVLGVATFYTQFSLTPQGRHKVCVCRGTACHVRGGKRIYDAVSQELGITAGETTEDMQFSLQTVACLGACALSPVMKVGDSYYGKISTRTAVGVLRTYKQEQPQ